MSTLTKKEKKTFVLHIIYSVFDGIVYGILAMNEFVLLKSLKGTDYQVGFLFQIPVIVLLFAIVFNEIIRRTANKKHFINIFTILSRLPLFLILTFPDSLNEIKVIHQYIFLFILLIYYFSTNAIIPVINLFLRQNYSHENFGKYYSYASSISKIVALISTFSAGYLLDYNMFLFKQLYAFMGLVGIISIFILTRIDYQDIIEKIKTPLFKSISNSFKRMKNILKFNRPFLHFEMAFMFYGFAFLSTQGVISLFLNNELRLNYTSLAFYKNAYNTINILLLPIFGRIIGKIDPRRFARFTFLSMALFLFFLFVATWWRNNITVANVNIYYSLLIAYFFYGVFSATMGLLWYIGSAYFSKDYEAADYQSIHLSLTGVRGVFAPLIGIYFYTLLNYSGVYLLGIFSLLIAIAIMIYSQHKFKKVPNGKF